MKLIIAYEQSGLLKVTETDELCRVRDGFWIDSEGSFCQSHKAAFYILPHMIKEIRKEGEAGFENYKAEDDQ